MSSFETFIRKSRSLPPKPGVYLFKDASNSVVYVGKAKNLRNRVRQYIKGGDGRIQIPFLVKKVCDLEVVVTRNEKEALLLEITLIQKHKPKYNIRLKDDKSYWHLKITSTEEWPRLLLTRRVRKDGNKYLGPFHSSVAIRQTLDASRTVFPMRTCSNTVFKNRTRPCLEYQIKRCLGPCTEPVDPREYRQHMENAVLLLQGKNKSLVKTLQEKMGQASQDLRYEEAARYRDQITAIEKTALSQHVSTPHGNDQDVFGMYREGGIVEGQILFIRGGKLQGNQGYSFDDNELPNEHLLGDLLTQFYYGDRFIPDEIVLPVRVEDMTIRAEILSERRQKKVSVHHPKRGTKAQLVRMAEENARQNFLEKKDNSEQREKTIENLRRALRLRNSPKRIECFDISNTQSTGVVASMVVFDDAEPAKDSYRRFHVRTVTGQDDFASMYEVLTRRYKRALDEHTLPDLLMVDGGKGQLNVAVAVLKELDINTVDIIGLAKMRTKRALFDEEIERSAERVFLPNRKDPIVLKQNSTALFLLQRLRDEAHRFAITFHRSVRSKQRLRSTLDNIPGVGPTKRRALLRHFGSVKRIREAGVDDLSDVPGIAKSLAKVIHSYLQPDHSSIKENQLPGHKQTTDREIYRLKASKTLQRDSA